MTEQEYAAHQIAKHLRKLAYWLNEASEDAWRANCEGSERVKPEYLEMLVLKAQRVEATAPFTPITEQEKDALHEEYGDMLADRSTREVFEDYFGDWTEADYRYELDNLRAGLGEDPMGDWHGRNE